jgi:transcriptional antiterminator Rof (Rho-off)
MLILSKTINLDNAYALEKRLREGQKKKLLLREEILRVRAEREKVALRMDEIRIAHEKESNEAHVSYHFSHPVLPLLTIKP